MKYYDCFGLLKSVKFVEDTYDSGSNLLKYLIYRTKKVISFRIGKYRITFIVSK